MAWNDNYEKHRDELLERFKEDPECKECMDILLDEFYDCLSNHEGESEGIGLDGKRPFGNSDIIGDVAHLLDIEIYNEETDERNEDAEDYCFWLYDHLWAYTKYRYRQSKENTE